MEPTHRDLAKLAAQWLLSQRWCTAACWELGWTGGVVDAIGVSGPSLDRRHADRVEQHHRRQEAGRRYGFDAGEAPRLPRGRIEVVEVKRTRSDLLGDLRRGKMLGYEERASHCVLACWESCLPDAAGAWGREARAAALADLAEIGLPARWGALALYRPRYAATAPVALVELRRATRLRRVDRADREELCEAMARSFAYRLLRGSIEPPTR